MIRERIHLRLSDPGPVLGIAQALAAGKTGGKCLEIRGSVLYTWARLAWRDHRVQLCRTPGTLPRTLPFHGSFDTRMHILLVRGPDVRYVRMVFA